MPKAEKAALEPRECAAQGCTVKFIPSRITQKYHARECGQRESNRSRATGHPARARVVSGEEVSNEELLEHEVRELRGALTVSRKTQVRDERMVQELRSLIPAFEPIYDPPSPETTTSQDYTEHAFVLQWSDLHAGERVFSDQMGGINAYDWDVMLDRHDKILSALQSFKENRPYPVRKLYVAALGDMVTGDIHDELRVTNEKVIMETALQLGLDGARFIERLIPHFEEIEFHGIVGNHGRMAKKPQAKNQHDNFDWMVYHLIANSLEKYPSVKINVPTSAYTYFRVFDRWTCFLLHGDGISTNMPGVPWGGVQRRTRELERQFEQVCGHIHHFLLGHFHQPNIVDNRRIIVNGSVKGPDEYSVKKFGAGSPAVQNLLTFHPRRGLTDVSFLDLQ